MEAAAKKIMVAMRRFACPICGRLIRKGDNYVDQYDGAICIHCGLPTRRLKPLNK